MFKIEMALVFAIVAALVAGLAGLIAGARYSTVFFRALAGFCTAGSLVYIGFFLLDRYGMPVYLRKNPSLQKEWVSEAEERVKSEHGMEPGETLEQPTAEALSPAAEDAGSESKAPEEQQEFTPLAADGLQHVSSSKDS